MDDDYVAISKEDDLAPWREALQLLPLAEEVAASAGTHLRVLFQPAFHAPGCLTLHLQDRASIVEFVVLGPTVSAWVWQASRQRDPAPVSSSMLADLHWATAPIPIDARARFQRAVTGIPLVRLGDTRSGMGRDGMLIDGEVVADGVAGTFAAWSPTASGEPTVYQACLAVLDLARACLRDAQSQTALGNLQRYLHAG